MVSFRLSCIGMTFSCSGVVHGADKDILDSLSISKLLVFILKAKFLYTGPLMGVSKESSVFFVCKDGVLDKDVFDKIVGEKFVVDKFD